MATKPIRSHVYDLDSVHRAHARSGGPKVILRFDDAYQSLVNLALPEMQKYGYVGTVLVPTGWIGTTQTGGQVCSAAELLTLSAAGWEIGSHTQTHIDCTANLANTIAQLDGSIADLLAIGLPYPQSFAYPAGTRNASTDKEVYRRFRKCFITGVTSYIQQHHAAPCFYLGWAIADGITNTAAGIERMKRYVEASFNTGRHAVLGFHGFTNGVPGVSYNMNIADFKTILAWLFANGYPVGLARDTAPHNLIQDMGFERFAIDTDANLGYPWLTNSNTYISRVASGAHSGTHCVKVDTGGNVVASDNLSQWIAVEPGKAYTLKAWVYAPTVTAGGFRCNVYHQNQLNATVATDFGKVNVTAANGAWTEYTASFTAASKAEIAKIAWQLNGFNGVAYLDDVAVYRSDIIDPLA